MHVVDCPLKSIYLARSFVEFYNRAVLELQRLVKRDIRSSRALDSQ